MHYSQEHLKTMVYAKFRGQTECIMGNWKIENSTLNAVRQVMFFNVKIEKFVGGNFPHFRCLACWLVEFNYKCLLNRVW